MSVIAFDTHAFVKRLRAVGFTEEQAETFAEAQCDTVQQLVTRDDLQRELRELEYRMIVKLGALMVAAVGIVATLSKLL